MKALTSSFKYDQDGKYAWALSVAPLTYPLNVDFYQLPRHFDLIYQPLVSQLSIFSALPTYTSATVIPCIAAFASTATRVPEHLRSVNKNLLRLLKSEKQRTRLAAVHCQKALTQTMGEDWLAMMPEMLPVISELQEDEDERVEQATHEWIKIIEGTLGESLAGMLQ